MDEKIVYTYVQKEVNLSSLHHQEEKEMIVMTRSVGWEKYDPTTKWRQLREHLPTVTLGMHSRHFRDQRITSGGSSGDLRGK